MAPRVVVVVAFFALCLVTGSPARAQAGQWFTTPAVLKEMFPTSERVAFVDVDGAALRALGIPTIKKAHHVYVAWTGDHLDGYAVVDEERGQHEPIGFAIQIDPKGVVQRVEVMAYREAYGAEIRAARYRKQFVGKALADLSKPVVDVDAISGATLSCKSTVIVVRRALALAGLAKQQTTTTPAAP
ncbi:MAG: FMN-binding protein [Deltaproteobacteria bacterium]|nr:FMN-binding protein [Deltaproteobacteria bacterium]